jgi:hypothetical protein
MTKKTQLLGLMVLTIMLTACGGSSNSSGSSNSNNSGTGNTETNTPTPTPVQTAKITDRCSDVDNNVSISSTGCIYTSGTSNQTAICQGNVIKMLSGTDHTAADISSKGSSFSANSITINNKKLSCV